MQNFCTLFNSNYLSRGLAMYNSLLHTNAEFHLYIFAFDDACQNTLKKLELSHATIVPLKEFETPELLSVKIKRTAAEYCWTCTPFTILHCIDHFSLDHCTYVDADLLFFTDPKVLTDEMGPRSVLITGHRYSPEYDQSETSGIYCVQFVTFKNTTDGMAALYWWAAACLEWCYARFEDGKFGDQKYLDDWTERFAGVHVLSHPGGGIAPWNAKDYDYRRASPGISIQSKHAGQPQCPLVFYHFHDFRYCQDDCFRLTAIQYFLPDEVIAIVYADYIRALTQAGKQIAALGKETIYHEPFFDLKWVRVSLSRRLSFILNGRYKNYVKRKTLYNLI